MIAFGQGWLKPIVPSASDYIMSAAFTFADPARLEAVLRLGRAFAARVLDVERTSLAPLPAPSAIGDETQLFHVDWFPDPGAVVRRLLRNPYLHKICLRRYDAGIEGMRATIIGGYEPARTRCVAVTIEAGSCYRCRSRSPYDSRAGLRAIFHALRPREPRP